jgi:molecular chaperone DnaK (HSP70)
MMLHAYLLTCTQDVLMMDALPMGLAVKTASGTYEVLLHKNSPIPATASRTFALEHPAQRGVTVDVVEVETSFTSGATVDTTVDATVDMTVGDLPSKGAHTTSFSFLLVEVDQRTVPRECQPRTCTVTIAMTAQGAMVVSVNDSWEKFAVTASNKQIVLLTVYCVLLLVAYVVVKVLFAAQLSSAARDAAAQEP